MLNRLRKNYIFAVIRGKSPEDAMEIAHRAILGGIKTIEITYSTPNASDVIRQLAEEFANDNKVIIGAGTVMTEQLAQLAIDAGAEFLVSPHFSADIQTVAQAAGVIYLPGCATVTEIVTATNLGCELIKLFPGGVLGISFLKSVHGPLPEVKMMPSGGVNVGNIKQWKDAGAYCVGVGSDLVSKLKEDGYASVTEIAQKFIQALGE